MAGGPRDREPSIVIDPRVERTRAHVLGHARALLTEGGPSAVTYSDLANRARVTRQTLYRHWPTREALFVDLALDGAAAAMPDGTAPTPEATITEFLRGMRAGMDDPSNAAPITALMAQADHDPASAHALLDIVGNVRTALNEALAPAGVALDAATYARLCGPVLFQRFIAREPVSDELIDQLVQSWSTEQG